MVIRPEQLLKTDMGGLASICAFMNYSGATVYGVWYYVSFERYLIPLSNDVVIKRFKDISGGKSGTYTFNISIE